MDPLIALLSDATFLALFGILAAMLAFTAGGFLKRRIYPQASFPLTVLIPAYNEERNIANCIKSVQSSKYGGLAEIIVADDGSTDNTATVAEGLGVKVLKQNHLGKVEALNLGIREARNGIIVILDADTTIEEDALAEVVKPFADERVGAVSGIVKVLNKNKILGAFQNIEYNFNSIQKSGFSRLFNASFGLYGSFSCYRKSALEKAGGFRKTTATEDVDMSLLLKKAGYTSLTIHSAVGHTVAPGNIKGFVRQRVRWTKGILQTIISHKDMVSAKYPPLAFVILAHYFWYIYSFLSLPLLFYQFAYWLPYNTANLFDTGFYTFRWFSLFGPFYTLYMLPVWGFSIFSFFAVLSGIITASIIVIGLRAMGEKIGLRELLCIFFYFPYTILISIVMMAGTIKYIASGGRGTFIGR